jgi:hypothetical protein
VLSFSTEHSSESFPNEIAGAQQSDFTAADVHMTSASKMWRWYSFVSGSESLWCRSLVRLVVWSGLFVYPAIGVWNPYSQMWEDRWTMFGATFTLANIGFSTFQIVSISTLANVFNSSICHSASNPDEEEWWVAGAETEQVMKISKGHMLRLLADLDLDKDGRHCSTLKWWIRVGMRLTGFVVFVFCGGTIIHFVVDVLNTDKPMWNRILGGWYSFLVVPIGTASLGMFFISLGVSNAATVSHCKIVTQMIHTGKHRFTQDVDVLDDMMDRLVDLNENVIPLLMGGWSRSFATGYCLSLFYGLCVVFKVFHHDYHGDDTARGIDAIGSFLLVIMCHVVLLLPASVSDHCIKACAQINALRHQRRSASQLSTQESLYRTASGRDRVAVIRPVEALMRVDCLSNYVRDANDGKGMGYALMGSRLSSNHVQHMLRLLISGFIYIYARQDAITLFLKDGTTLNHTAV